MTLAYRRFEEENEIIVAFNRGEKETTMSLPVAQAARYKELLSTGAASIESKEDQLMITLPSLSGIVLQRQ